ncbi:MAG: S8 family serine peptidase, partial [Verrucomicrobia bacterium]|nr:S8 family serine peptidase [Verrucomicrobiota bacterium]
MRLRSKIWLALILLPLLLAVLLRRVDQSPPAPASWPTPPGRSSPAGRPATGPGRAAAPASYVLRNTPEPLARLMRQDSAVLLRNAWIDTRAGPLTIPNSLRAHREPGSYIVQARGLLDDRFRTQLQQAGATVVSYIPNNAYLVQLSADSAKALAAAPQIQAVLPFEPYYKLDTRLLGLAVNQQPVPPGQWLNVTLFAGNAATTLATLQSQGAEVVAQDRSPFGPVVTLQPGSGDLAALAQLPGVKEIEPYAPRVLLNDLTRVALGVSPDTVTTNNYLGLTGSGVLVNVNDSGVDAKHPDLTGRVLAASPGMLTDTNGHGTHVAGIIAGNGAESATVTNAIGSVPGASFRGEAPAARLFVLPADPSAGPLISDSYLQETAAKTNALISNNSWGYAGDYSYDTAAASYDAAVRDALPEVTGSQPVLFVFAAGDNGGGTDDGLGGAPDTLISPATAKNVITVGALESPRGITNNFIGGWTSSSNAVAAFSSRGNVGVGIEGPFGRYKPDVVAPGAFIVSARSEQWNGLQDPLITSSDPNATNDLPPLDAGLGPYYRYDSGTSMSAAAVTGVLALMEQFFQQRGHQPSPALMKALLINGARAASPAYDFQTTSLITYEGWGLVAISNSIPPGLSFASTANAPAWCVDQGTANALATGQSRSWTVNVASNAMQLPLHVTLAWTDPPGDPAAALKLVNNLDLVVINNGSGEIFFGNNFLPGSQLSLAGVTNITSTNLVSDVVNNVENVILPPPLGTNYTVTVIARRVNVNAVTASPTGVVQDFALVVGIDDPTVTNAFTVASTPTPPPETLGLLAQPITVITNGAPLLNQRVGANSPLSGSTNGVANQWNFYIYTNSLTTNVVTGPTGTTNLVGYATNVAFVTFQPPNISRPRNVEADLDLYSSTDPGLTNLDSLVIAAAQKSVGRGGTELIFYTNATPNQVFYLGVKSEDQQGGEFGLIGLSSLQPFDQPDLNGNRQLVANPTGLPIPEGSPDHPGEGIARAIAIATSQITVRRVIVHDTILHQSFGDLVGNLSHGSQFAVLNNHTQLGPTPGVTNTFVYDDSGQGDIPLARPSDGPGSLNSFIGANGMGVWFFNIVDNALGGTGVVQNVTITLQPTTSGPLAGISGTLAAGRTFYDVIDVPPDATNLVVSLSNLNLPVDLYVRRGALPTPTDYDKKALINPPSGQLTLSIYDSPPLAAGRYYIAIYNPNGLTVSFTIVKYVQLGLQPVAAAQFLSTDTPKALPDDALTNSVIQVPDVREVVAASVGVRINHPRVSDLVLHLISPQGTRVLLVENRGGASAANFGSGDINSGPTYLNFTEDTNLATLPIKFAQPPFFTTPPPSIFISGFEPASVSNYVAGKIVDGWAVLTNQVAVIDTLADTGTHSLDMQNGAISRTLPTTAGTTYALRFAYRAFRRFAQPNVNLAQVLIYPDPDHQLSFIIQGSQAALDNWQHTALVFTATQNGTPIEFRALNIGLDILVDSFYLGGVGSDLYYLPEEPLSLLAGEPSQGDWTLEVLDNRTGATLPSPSLLGWKLQLDYAETNYAAIPMTNGICYTGTNLSTAVQYFSVDVPRTATVATNSILPIAGTGNPVLLFNQNGLPTPNLPGTVVVNNNGPALPETLILTTNSSPPLVPGQRYYLGVMYTNAAPSEANIYDLCVNFDRTDTNLLSIITLTNNVPYTNTIAAGLGIGLDSTATAATSGALDYYHFHVDQDAYQANFMVFPQNGDVDLVVVQARPVLNPLPTAPNPPKCGTCPFYADYYSDWPSTTTERIMIQANSTIPLTPGDYYIGVQNADNHPVTYTIVTSELTGPFNVIQLTNNVSVSSVAPVGTTISNYFRFSITQTNTAAVFELTGVSGKAALVVQTNGYFPDNYYNYYQRMLAQPPPDANYGMLVISNEFLPTLNGDWILAVANRDINPVSFTLKATVLTNTFSIVALTNGVPFTASIAPSVPGQSAPINYFSFDVATNASYVEFEATPTNGDVDLVVSRAPLLPSPTSYDYASVNGGTANELIRVGPGSQPVPLEPGRWYLGVYNLEPFAVTYRVMATEAFQNVITLTNGVPYTNTVAPSDILDYYRYVVSSNADHLALQLLSTNGPVNFFIRQGFPLPDPGLFDYTGTNQGWSQQVTLYTNSSPVPLGPGDWFIGVTNETNVPVTYSLLATEVLLPQVTNVVITPVIEISSNEVCITWDSLAGINYYVAGKAALNNPTWTPVSPTILATNTITTYCLALPSPYHLFAVLPGISPITPPPSTNAITPSLEITATDICLTWDSLVGTNYFVEAKAALTDPAWTAVSPTLLASSTTTTYCLPLPTTNHFFQVIVGASPLVPPSPTNIAVTPDLNLASNELCLSWEAQVGTNYYVEGKAALSDPAWTAISPTILATNNPMTYCLALPTTNHFFQVIAGTSPLVPVLPPSTNIVVTPDLNLASNELCLSWEAQIGTNYYLEGKVALTDPAWTAVSPTIVATNNPASYCLTLPTTNRFFQVVIGDSPLVSAQGGSGTNLVLTPSLELTNSEVCLSWASLTGTNYVLQGATTLASTNWVNVSPTLAATNQTTTFCLPSNTT